MPPAGRRPRGRPRPRARPWRSRAGARARRSASRAAGRRSTRPGCPSPRRDVAALGPGDELRRSGTSRAARPAGHEERDGDHALAILAPGARRATASRTSIRVRLALAGRECQQPRLPGRPRCRRTSTAAPSAASDVEVYQSFSETPLTKHEGCGGKLAKVLSPAGIVLKGSGFYKTDNRTAGAKKRSTTARSSSEQRLEVLGLDELEFGVVGLRRRRSRRAPELVESSTSSERQDPRKPVRWRTRSIGVFGGSGFYTFLDDVDRSRSTRPTARRARRSRSARSGPHGSRSFPRHGRDHEHLAGRDSRTGRTSGRCACSACARCSGRARSARCAPTSRPATSSCSTSSSTARAGAPTRTTTRDDVHHVSFADPYCRAVGDAGTIDAARARRCARCTRRARSS